MGELSGGMSEDGGPPRWFCPLDTKPRKGEPGYAGDPLPLLYFLPGIEGTGIGLSLHHRSLSRLFSISCLHVPTSDRTSFQDLVDLIASHLISERSQNPKQAMFVFSESFGSVLALAVAAQNPKLDLRLVLVNPATSFQRSPLQPYLPLLRSVPSQLYATVPFLLSFTISDPLRMAGRGIPSNASPWERASLVRDHLLELLPQLPMVTDILPQDTLRWKLELLDVGSRYMEKVIESVRAPVLILASGADKLLPSKEESRRLKKILPKCIIRDYADSGHSLLLEEGPDIGSVLKGSGFYRKTAGSEDAYLDSFVPPSEEDLDQARNGLMKFIRFISSPVSFSTTEDGKVVQGLSGIPANERPILFIGNHQTYAPDLSIVVDEILRGTGLLARGLAHPMVMGQSTNLDEGEGDSSGLSDFFRLFGAVPVKGSTLYKLMAKNDVALLFPGGVREALRRKGEEYQLFWPDKAEFVRMAARHGATIIPYAAVGVDDGLQILLDADDQLKLPYWRDRITENLKNVPRVRAEGTEGDAVETFIAPIIAPGSPKRLYFLFRKPIRTKGMDILKDKEKTMELYQHVKSEVADGLQYLLTKREEDPYKELLPRILYEASWGDDRQAPTFEP